MRCSAQFPYPDQTSAREAKKKWMRAYHIATNIRHCEFHDAYHLTGDVPRLLLPKKALDVLKMIAQGFTTPEISKNLNMKAWTVTWYARVLRLRFNAMSSAHLISICDALGVLHPSEYIPEIKPIPQENNNGQHNSDKAHQKSSSD